MLLGLNIYQKYSGKLVITYIYIVLLYLVNTKHPYVHCSVIYNPQDMEAAQVSISR